MIPKVIIDPLVNILYASFYIELRDFIKYMGNEM